MSDRYVGLRKQLAELGRSLIRASTQFPGSIYEFIESDAPLSYVDWRRWINCNRAVEDLKRERWDIFPAGWATDHDKFELVDAECTRICGVFYSPPTTLDAAQAELEHLADTGTKILLAIRSEVKRSTLLDKVGFVPSPLPDGHRGWLDMVRNTAEINRGINLKVDYRVFPAAGDRQSQLAAMRKSLAKTNHDSAQSAPRPNGFSACRVTPDIFSASANAITIWLQGKQSQPIVPTVCSDLAIPRLLSPDGGDDDLEILCEPSSRQDQRPAAPATTKPKRKTGRPRADAETQSRDRRLFDALKTGTPRNVLVREFGISEIDVKRGIDRERKRRERSRSKLP